MTAKISGDNKTLIFCGFGIIFAFGLWGYVLESLTTGKKMSEIGTILINSFFFTAVSRGILLAKGKTPASVPHKQFAMISTTYVLGMLCTFRALRYVSFPTQVLAKSCRPIPITIMNFFLGKRYSTMVYISVMLLCGGVSMFMLGGDASKGGGRSDTMFGMVILAISLVFDGLTGALEDKALDIMGWSHGQGTFDLMYFINLWSIPVSIVGMVLAQDYTVFDADTLQMKNMLALGMAGSIGQVFIFYTISNFGALVCAMLTTIRKVFTITFSVIMFGHILSVMQFMGVVVAFGGLGLNVRERAKQSSMPATKSNTPLPMTKVGLLSTQSGTMRTGNNTK